MKSYSPISLSWSGAYTSSSSVLLCTSVHCA